ncbi:MAG: hypothetical protein WCW27_00130 [Patescibacteria group bacterium]|jgi:hypothetical protein
MKKLLIGLFIIIGIISWFNVAKPVQAAKLCLDPLCGFDSISGGTGTIVSLTDTGLGSIDPVVAAAQIINVGLRVLGFFTVVITIYGGFIWIWARGNEEEIQKGKDMIKGSIFGMVVILGSFGILQWFFYYFTKITNAVL